MLHRLRRDLDRARTLIDLCKRRERTKRSDIQINSDIADDRLRYFEEGGVVL